MSHIVTRTFGADFIYFDLVFLVIWITILVRKRHFSAIRWGIAGWIIYILIDYLLWYRIMGSRHYSGSLYPELFFAWFCFSPGFVQFSYVIVMFEKRSNREILFWTFLFYSDPSDGADDSQIDVGAIRAEHVATITARVRD